MSAAPQILPLGFRLHSSVSKCFTFLTHEVTKYISVLTGHTGLGSAPLWASILRRDSQEAVVWRPEASSTRSWREATVFLGAIPSAFRVRLHSQRSEGQTGDVAVDQLEFLDCALPCEALISEF